jgi:hypothetical protein
MLTDEEWNRLALYLFLIVQGFMTDSGEVFISSFGLLIVSAITLIFSIYYMYKDLRDVLSSLR